jgi:hypothetical protein
MKQTIRRVHEIIKNENKRILVVNVCQDKPHAFMYRVFIPESFDQFQDVPCGIRTAQADSENTERHLPKLHNCSWLVSVVRWIRPARMLPHRQSSSGLPFQIGTWLHLTAC